MPALLNLGIMKNPLNWAIVTLMVLIALIGAHYARDFMQQKGNG